MACLRSLALLLVCWTASAVLAQDQALLDYHFDEGQGAVAKDSSGHQLDGRVSATWTDSPAGKALSFDGKAGQVSVMLPPEQRFGRGSWTFSAWLKPAQFTIDDAQNQRRLFAFGTYPDAYLVIDLMGNGRLSSYFCFKDAAGKIVSAGSGSATGLALGQWAHVVLVCDRQAGKVEPYINGFGQGSSALPPEFTGDFGLGGELTLGNGWHDYAGVMDEVRVYRRALTRAEIRAEFARLKDTFGAIVAPAAASAEKREELMDAFAKSHEAWAAGRFAEVRMACTALYQSTEAPAALRSYAHLRAAQSWEAEGKPAEARAAYTQIAATADYPGVHRAEAVERVRELDRVAAGQPPRDPAATRTKVPTVAAFAAEVWVSPKGDDAHAGTRAEPVAGLTRARDLVRALRAQGTQGPIAVQVLPGEYRVTAPLELAAQDSNVHYRAAEPGKAVFYGGTRLSGFQPVTDPAILARLPEEGRGHVLRCDLRAQGLTDYGQLAVRGFSQPPSPPTLELFVNGRAMTLARWPNRGFVPIRKLVEPGNRSAAGGVGKPSVFEYGDERHARWTQADDAWLFGYFRYLWADATIKVTKVDPQTHTVSCGEAYQYGGPGMDTGQGIQYYAFNLLEEIDQPGEWYLDRKAGVLYLYPPTDLAGATVEIGLLSQPMVTMSHATDVRLEGLTFDLARYNGVELTECSRCLIAGCTVSRMAGNGITISGGEADGLLGCDIHTIGRRATEVIGGDRVTLTPGRHFVENCQIHNFGRIDRTYTPAIQLEGVGNRVAHNLMYDCPSSVMRIEGNDHLIEFNDVHSAVQESDDQGAMELFGNPTYRGVVFRHNRFVNCGKTGTEAAVNGQAAIRFDDAISGMVVYGNVFVRSANGHFGAIQMNSGRDNIMDNNLFVDCKQGISGGWYPANSCWKEAASKTPPAAYIMSALYLQRYPEMATMLADPGINHVWRNVFYRCGPAATGNAGNLDMVENGEFATNPGFADPEKGDWHLKAGSALWQRVGFRAIPVDEIGLYQDAYRATWPVVTTPVAVPDWRTRH